MLSLYVFKLLALLPSPFTHSDIVTTTTHKTLRGPRAGMIFYRKGVRAIDDKTKKEVLWDLEERINFAVFPSLQGGPHNNTIAAINVCLKEAMAPEYVEYQHQVLKNCKTLATEFLGAGYTLVSGGTDNHLLLLDLRPTGLDGARAEAVMEACNITVNKNTVPGDTRPFVPGGLRIGTPALTSRGFKERDFATIGQYLHRAIKIGVQINSEGSNAKSLKTFKDNITNRKDVDLLQKEVAKFASSFPMPY